MFFFFPSVGPLTLWDVVGGAIFGAGLSILVLLSFFFFALILGSIWLALVEVGTWLSSKLSK